MQIYMSELIQTKRYASGDEFLRDISYGGDMYQNLKGGFVFRGHQSGSYKLIPSVLRHKPQLKDAENNLVEDKHDLPFNITESEFIQMTKEYMALKDFFEICDKNSLRLPVIERFRRFTYSPLGIISFFFGNNDWLPEDLQELAALAQHYGMETRLLDWTTNIETAIYFAVHKEPNLNQEDFSEEDSDCVAIWALHQMVNFGLDIPLRIIRPPYFGNPNLAAQKGLFTFWNVSGLQLPMNGNIGKDGLDVFQRLTNRKPLNELIVDEFKKTENKDKTPNFTIMWKLLIPRSDRKVLYEYIRSKNVSAASLFPGYEGVVRSLKEDRSFNL